MSARLRVGIFGAGAIGVFVGGRLAASGLDVTLVGRPRVLDPIAAGGLTLEDLEGPTRRVEKGGIECATDASALGDCDVVIVTTKAAGTAEAARAIAASTKEHVAVVSLQNGVDGPRTLRDVLGLRRGYGGMIAYNVVFKQARVLASEGPDGSAHRARTVGTAGASRFEQATTLRRATSGPIVIERQHALDEEFTRGSVPRLIDAMNAAGLGTIGSRDIARVLWSKLLFNLNNALNALSGLPLQKQLRDRGYRRLMATMMREGMAVMAAQDMRPMRFGLLYAPLAARVLPLPNAIFERLAGAMLRVDPEARSSMADDLALRRPTEIDALNGAIVRAGAKYGVPTPLNARVVEAIRAAEAANAGSPGLRPEQVAG